MAENKDKLDIFSIPGVIPIPKTKKVPRLGTIVCEKPILAEENFDGYDEVDFDIDCNFSLKCQDDSMINARIYNGDIVYVKQQPTVNNGEIAAIAIAGKVTIKRVFLSKNRIVLQPENPLYSPMIYIDEELNDIKFLGKAVYFKSFIK